MDLLADVVSALELRSSLYFRAAFSAPFGIAVAEDRQRIRFHVAGPGRSWIGLPSGESSFYAEGDLVLVPHGSAHVLASGPESPVRPLHEVLATAPPDAGVLRYGGDGAEAQIVCGHFSFDESVVHPLIGSLPPLVHVPAGAGAGFGWMTPLLEAIAEESASEEAAHAAVARRLSEVLFIQVMRSLVGRGLAGPGGMALADDPQLRRALASLHADPAADWSVSSLASLAGVSRSVFADRFRSRFGTTPMRYLASWRMQKARHLLCDRDLSVGEIGRRVGYASEAAFSRAFRDAFGQAPGRHRQALHARAA